MIGSDQPAVPDPVPVEVIPPRQTAAWRWWIHLVVLSAYPLLGLIVRLTTGYVQRGPALSGRVGGLLFVSGVELLFFGVFFLAAWFASRASRHDLLFIWRPGWWVVPLGVVYSFAVRFALIAAGVLVIAFLVLTRVMTSQDVQQYINLNRPDIESIVSVPAMRQSPAYYWLTLTLVSFVVAGFREEMWRAGMLAGMRTLWPRAFGSRIGQCGAMALIAVVFGAMHLRMGVIAAVGAGLIGFFLGLIMVLHKSVWPAIIAHGVFDATTLALLPWWAEKARHLHGP